MKKKALLLFTCTALLMTGCAGSNIADTVNNISDSISKEQTPTAAPTPVATPGPKETKVALGKKGTVGDWKIGVKKASVKTKITNGKYRQYTPGKGKSFVVISLSAQNNGEKAATFLPRIGYADKSVTATLLYQDKYEYSLTELLSYDKDLTAKKIQPLSTESGIVAFEVPKKVAKQKKKLKLRIGLKKDYLVYDLK